MGIDIGAETIKAVELSCEGGALRWARRARVEHHKCPGPALVALLRNWDWLGVSRAAVTGRLARQARLPRIPIREAQGLGFRFLVDDAPATLLSIGARGFSVLELREAGPMVLRENSRCSQGTGAFLRQLLERLSLAVEEADRIATGVENAASLSGRCPVILKTDMTHLANKGESHAWIAAGLFDAVCENALTLVRPGLAPPRVVLLGGLANSRRIRRTLHSALARLGMSLLVPDGDDGLYVEALGCALAAVRLAMAPPALDELLALPRENTLERLPGLAGFRPKARRLERPSRPGLRLSGDLILGLDIGSTASKAVALSAAAGEPVWEAYRETAGDPIAAAQALVHRCVEAQERDARFRAFAVTGSGREIVGSLASTCFGSEAVFVLNEIAAHAEGALSCDSRVDTIFEIGGQDAKYIQLAHGRIVDCAMNQACSAGTGSFIEEQGRRFADVREVSDLAGQALSSPEAVSLGQHCSVFMAETIDEAIAQGAPAPAIFAGLFDSVVQNYLDRVKGNRPVGQVVFCQGMPFSADALAAAVARHTGADVIVPPNPGTIGALGIALLARRHVLWMAGTALDLNVFLQARAERKETFVCRSTAGCGGAGSLCRIEALSSVVAGQRLRHTWGGACALHDRATRKRKLPDLAPDPFRQREERLQALTAPRASARGATVAVAAEFALKGLLPFFTAFLGELGLRVRVHGAAGQATLKRGIQRASVPFCAPMQLFHGVADEMAENDGELIVFPMLRALPRSNGAEHSVTCPIIQASPDLVRHNLGVARSRRVVSPVLDMGPEGLRSALFRRGCERLARALGVHARWKQALTAGIETQERFDADCLGLGRAALAFCREQDLPAVVVLGRPYTIYNPLLNSNVPHLLREQGAIAIPIDCYPVGEDVLASPEVYWADAQRILSAAKEVRRSADVYSIYCSNYSCGPDSFNLHFYAHVMEGKPFAVVETDGHAGDAGTKTRIEAFLHCVAEHRRSTRADARCRSLSLRRTGFGCLRRERVPLLMPRLGPATDAVAACLRGVGIRAEALPVPDADALRAGRRHTSGKECLPLRLTLGAILRRLEADHGAQSYALLLPTTTGPCRFGVYNLLEQLVLDRLGWRERVRFWSPPHSDYFGEMPPGLGMLVYAGCLASDLLHDALHTARPGELRPGSAQAAYERHARALSACLERRASGELTVGRALWEVASGRVFGVAEILRRAAVEIGAVGSRNGRPTVLLTGEIYLRCDPFANDSLIERLEALGLRVRLSGLGEWLDYAAWLAQLENGRRPRTQVTRWVRQRIRSRLHAAMAARLGWPAFARVSDLIADGGEYLRDALHGEAILTVGGAVHECRQREIDAVVSVGPLECMPNKIAEAQLFHAAEREGLLSLTLSLNGEPLPPEVLEDFAFEVRARRSHS